MARREHRAQLTAPKSDLVRRYEQEVQYHMRRRRRRRRPSRAGRVVKGVLLGVFTTFVIIPAMIAAGFLFGPRGVEGLIAAPIILLIAWASIMYWALVGGRPPALPALAKTTELARLPAQTDEWLEAQRHHLPQEAQRRLDSIGMRLEALSAQLQGVNSEQPATADLRRLLGDELPELVRGYRKLPRELQRQALHGGSSPERQLIEGLSTIDEQIGRMQEQLAADDMQALAVHQRYLELKYKREDDGL